MPDTPEPTSPDAEPETPQEDVKAAFRAALERKQAQNRKGQEHADSRSKVDNAHGPAAAKRTFRRKSG
ncbi:DUF5302 domain-containing protein [Actinophytocola sp.]|uniref:DUF5302 domain-containing protein n=1 Tax=Actinophytocola sp. TaxID=1872138 RepID=UPI00389AECC2